MIATTAATGSIGFSAAAFFTPRKTKTLGEVQVGGGVVGGEDVVWWFWGEAFL